MKADALLALLVEVADGSVSLTDAMERLRRGTPNDPDTVGYEILDQGDKEYARVDLRRAAVQGVAEVVFGEGKTPTEIAGVASVLLGRGHNVLVTRASEEAFHAVRAHASDARYDPRGRVIVVERAAPQTIGTCAVLSAGTSDLPVVDECVACLQLFGIATTRIVDVGVAGIHRVLAVRDEIDRHDVVIVVAGMEGALPSVVGGLTGKPVIAVPTSVGYGANLGGFTALLSMLNTCSAGVVVVNIDNGFGAAMAARRMLQGRA
jgi:NCAIR mutase (PurE)-related protein